MDACLSLEDQGFCLVDLDGASSGVSKNLDVLKKIIAQVGIPLEFGGGIRSMETISKLLDLGVQRVVLGTKAADDTDFLKKAWKKFREKIIVSIDAKDGRVLTQGWNRSSSKAVLDSERKERYNNKANQRTIRGVGRRWPIASLAG